MAVPMYGHRGALLTSPHGSVYLLCSKAIWFRIPGCTALMFHSRLSWFMLTCLESIPKHHREPETTESTVENLVLFPPLYLGVRFQCWSPAWTPSFLQIIQFQGTCCSLLLLGLDLNPLCSGIAEFSGFRSSLSKGCVFLMQVWRTCKPGREAGGPGRCLLSTVSRSWYTPCSAVNHHQPLLAKRLFTTPYPPVYFHSVFQFYWDRIDIQLRISLRCPASWLDLHVLWNEYHKSVVNIQWLM